MVEHQVEDLGTTEIHEVKSGNRNMPHVVNAGNNVAYSPNRYLVNQ